MMARKTRFVQLKDVFRMLHGPRGCLWDKKQTLRSLIPHLREEVREYIHAVSTRDVNHIKEELGDLLLHVMFSAQIASKDGKFDIEDVIAVLVRKLKRRHPHVFGTVKVKNARQIIRNWNMIKSREKRR